MKWVVTMLLPKMMRVSLFTNVSYENQITLLSKAPATNGVSVTLTPFAPRKIKKSLKNAASKRSSLTPGLQMVTAGKST